MPNISLESRISNSGTIHCRLTSDSEQPIDKSAFCFSLLASCRVINGGTIVGELGGFSEVLLDGHLSKDHPLEIEIAYKDPNFRPKNRAWLPLSPYLKLANGEILQVSWDNRGVVDQETELETGGQDVLRLVPQPTEWFPTGEIGSLHGFRLEGPIAATRSFQSVDELAERNSFPTFLTDAGTPVTAEICPDMVSAEYQIDLDEQNIRVKAADDKGFFYAAITLLTLITTHAGSVPLGVMKDQPRFSWRGQHLDCARHYFQPDTLMRFLDLLALMKLNVFHWHFADDEAFRLEVDCFPDLWKKSAFRGENQTLPGVFGGGSGPTGGSYSRSMVNSLLERAHELNIDVLPEVEAPAHALATARIFPFLRDSEDDGTETSVQEYQQNTLNPALPKTWKFLETLTAEVCGIFPFAHIHLGGDEVPSGSWQNSPKVRAMKSELALSTENDVLGYTMARLAKHVRKNGSRACAWEEAAGGNNGGIGQESILFSWSGQKPGLKAAQKGYDVVMCPAEHLYFDMAHSDDMNDWGATWCGTVNLADTINWNPDPNGRANGAGNIVGVQGAYWSEFTTDDAQMEPMIAPRILGLSCRAWSTQNGITDTTLTALANAYAPLFNAINWNWNRPASHS